MIDKNKLIEWLNERRKLARKKMNTDRNWEYDSGYFYAIEDVIDEIENNMEVK